ncbi:MAG: hypothetical protein MRK00_11725 [Nitrosomonas sp.]|nr:hypothetical protein [Nitrosomonas sp.]
MRHGFTYLNQMILIISAVFLTAQIVIAQPAQPDESIQQQTITQSYLPKPGSKPEQKFSTRTMQRTGTAITGARNSISIKSTDAGIIHYPPTAPLPYPNAGPGLTVAPSAAGCVNCGIIDFINIVGQGNALNAIASGIVAGTIARKIGGYNTYSHPNHSDDRNRGEHAEQRGQHQHYHVGITMHDGSQQIITVPDVSHLHQGDRIQLIDGIIIPEYKNQ